MKRHQLITMACVLSALCQTSFAAGQVFVTNEGSGDISVIDRNTDTVIHTIATQGKPRGLAVCRHDVHLYVSNQNGSQLQAIHTQTYAIEKTLTLGESPEAVYCSPDGQWVAVANEGSNSVSFISTAKWKVQFSIHVLGKNPEHAVFSPDGKLMLVSAEEADQVDVIDVVKRKQIKSIRVGNRPRGIAFSSDGKTAYVAVETDSLLVAIDVPKLAVKGTLVVGTRTNGLTMHPNGKWLFASNGGDANVAVIDTETFTVHTKVAVGQRDRKSVV